MIDISLCKTMRRSGGLVSGKRLLGIFHLCHQLHGLLLPTQYTLSQASAHWYDEAKVAHNMLHLKLDSCNAITILLS